MKDNLSAAKEHLKSGGFTLVLCRDETVISSKDRGVKPLVELIDNGIDTEGFSAADKVVGKAAAMLYCILKVREVYAPVMSKMAILTLKKHGINALYDEEADYIINRAKTGICPMEQTVKDTDNPEEAFAAIKERLKTL